MMLLGLHVLYLFIVVVEAFQNHGWINTRTATSITSVNRAPFLQRQEPLERSARNPSQFQLHAIAALVKKAKQAELRQYVEGGIEENVKEKFDIMKARMDSIDLSTQEAGPLQQSLTKRKGTITVIAEFKRKNDQVENGYIKKEIFDPSLLSPVFREFGASAVAVMADERMGGCNYNDIAVFAEEQRRASTKVPGPIPVINNDLIIDLVQIARSAAYGAKACVLNYGVVGPDDLPQLLKATLALEMEPIVAVSTKEEAQQAIDLGARIISVVNVDGLDSKKTVVDDLSFPKKADGEERQVCIIANVLARNDKQMQEIEEGWALRDHGRFNCVWVGDALYKAGASEVEHPGAIIKSLKSKSSLKWASPRAYSGRGEGAREYLGDILM